MAEMFGHEKLKAYEKSLGFVGLLQSCWHASTTELLRATTLIEGPRAYS